MSDEPDEIVVVEMVEKWSRSSRFYLEDLSRFRVQFEELFRLDVRENHETVAACAFPRDGCKGGSLTQLTKRLSLIRQASDQIAEKTGSDQLIDSGLLSKLHLQLVRYLVPSQKSAIDKQVELGESFFEFRTAVRALIPLVLRTTVDDRQDHAGQREESKHPVDDDKAESPLGTPSLIESSLGGQSLSIFRFLHDAKWSKGETQWTSFETLKARGDFWRGRPDPSEIEDETVFEALKRLRGRLNQVDGCDISLAIEKQASRTKLYRG